VGRLGWPGPPHFSPKLSKLELQTLNIFNGTIGEKHAYCQYRFVAARTSQSESKRELLRSEQADCECGGHKFLTGDARNKMQNNKIFTDFSVLLFRLVPRVYLKPPMPMDTNLHVCGREVNSVTMPRLK